jgi:hypothetical protein
MRGIKTLKAIIDNNIKDGPKILLNDLEINNKN